MLNCHVFLLLFQLTEEAALLKRDPSTVDGEWRQKAIPFAARALSICEQNPGTKPADMALALETEAEALGSTSYSKELWKRSTYIRRRLVNDLLAAPNTGEDQVCPSRKPLSSPLPIFPTNEKGTAYSIHNGIVQLSFVVNSIGHPVKIKLLRGLGFGLDEAAADMLSCWRFKPGTRNGANATVPATIEVKFPDLFPPLEPIPVSVHAGASETIVVK